MSILIKLKKLPLIAAISICFSLLVSEKVKAAAFAIADPEVDFEVIDGGSSGVFDGLGDEVFPTFNNVIRGSQGEAAALVEFDISSFLVPPSDVETAEFRLQLARRQVNGLGVNPGENPNILSIYGYAGNGIAEASDFQAGTLLGTLDISSAAVGDFLSFDVAPLVKNLLSDENAIVGLGVRAQDFGGVSLQESSTFSVPSLQITTPGLIAPSPIIPTTPEPLTTIARIPEPSSALGILALATLGAGSMLKRQHKSG
jgi:hypothetical protein